MTARGTTMTKSSLCTYTNLTSNRSTGRGGNKVCKITPHYMCAHWTGRQCADYFASTSRQASSNYCIGYNGDIAMSVDENNRAWTSSSGWNDRQAITIECANASTTDSTISAATWDALVNLCADICTRYGITPSYDGTKNATFTEHRMFASTDCPGAYMHARMNKLVADVKAKMAGSYSSSTNSGSSGLDLGDMRYTGPKMISEWQRQLGTSVDGKLSNQSEYNRKNPLWSIDSSCFDGSFNGSNGSSVVKAAQAKVGVTQDGQCGHNTVKAIQNKLISWGYSVGSSGADGYWGHDTSYAFGQSLQDGRWK